MKSSANRIKEHNLSVCAFKCDKDTNWVCQFGPTKGRFKRGPMIVSNAADGMSLTSARLQTS